MTRPGLALDRWLGRVSMYLVVTGALVVVLLWALVQTLAGSLFFGPGALLLATVVAVASCAVGTVAGSRLVRAPAPHPPSAVITGLILALVLPPALGTELLGIAVAGLAAGLSKYLLVWRGRHLLNPAVAGLLVAGWTGLAPSWWWVGSSTLFWVVAAAGLVVLWRTRRLLFAASYAVPALVLTVIGYLSFGSSLGQAFSFAMLSGPIAFLAAFMLSEPLTTPPRQHQRIAVGALVGVLSAAPLLLEWGWLTPEVALAVGNLVAFALGQRGVALRLVSRSTTETGVLDLVLRPSVPLRFTPGQYVEIDVPSAQAYGALRDPRGRRRVLSLASAPGSGNDLTLCGTLSGVEMGLQKAGVPYNKGGVQAALDYLAQTSQAHPG